MGCAASKEINAASKKKSTSFISKKLSLQRALKRVFLDGVLLKDQRRKSLQVNQPPLQISSSPSTLREILQKEGEIQLLQGEKPQQEALEIINVWELMEGLEDEVEADDRASGTNQEQDPDLGSSSFSSPESGVRNSTGGSPTSPLCFDSSATCRRHKEMDMVVTRNFSFNLRSSVDQLVATPKMILDSTSPLVLQQTRIGDLKQRLNIDSSEAALASCCFDFPRGPELETDHLLSSFELMMDQIARDAWTVSTPASVTAESQQAPELTLYFTTEDQELSTVSSILQSYGIAVNKKNVSSDPSFMTDDCIQFPALFINGRYIGGAQQLCELKEKNKLKLLLEGPNSSISPRVCNGCCGICLVPCLDCNGSRRFMAENGELEHCTECTEEGMVTCPLCS